MITIRAMTERLERVGFVLQHEVTDGWGRVWAFRVRPAVGSLPVKFFDDSAKVEDYIKEPALIQCFYKRKQKKREKKKTLDYTPKTKPLFFSSKLYIRIKDLSFSPYARMISSLLL
jgi:hypothetical protein